MSTFGTTSAGGSTYDNIAGNVVWAQATTNPSSGTLTQIAFVGRAKFGSPTVEAAIYLDNAASPGNKLAQSAGTVAVGGLGTYAVNMPAQSLTNQQYWLGLRVTNFSFGITDAEIDFIASGGNELFFINAGAFPADGSGSTAVTERWTVWGVYTPDAPPASPQCGRRIFVLP